MGEVYAAIDPRLGRKIALKVLPAEFAADPDRAARFEREARAIAALNHPNIVTVHSVETLDGLPVLTMELVEGRTLADLIPKQGLALDKFLQIAVPLADAISAAHEKGITHRDLKPTNVMVTPEGRVKVLDFGLAKLRGDTTAAQLAGDPTRALTTAGHIVGTVAYMSPEQAEARAVDERSDIFSLGIVLYEMATGQRPFKGDTNVSVLASIVRDTPRPIADVRPDLPSDLVKIVRKALAKDPERRYQSAKDLRNDLDIVREDAASGALALPAQAAPTRGNRAARVWFAAAAVLGALATAVFLRTRLAEPHSGASVEATFTQLTFQPGMERFPSLSPDGKWIVYSAAGEGDEDIYLQSVSGQNAIDLTKDSRASDTQPVFSPDGERIAFRSEREGGGLFLMGRTGEAVRRLTRSGFTPTWSPDGRQIGYSTADSAVTPYSGRGLGELWVVDVATGASRKISVTGDIQGGRQPAWSPDGAHIAFRSGLANLDRCRRGRSGDARQRRRRERVASGMVTRRPVHLLFGRSRRPAEPLAHARGCTHGQADRRAGTHCRSGRSGHVFLDFRRRQAHRVFVVDARVERPESRHRWRDAERPTGRAMAHAGDALLAVCSRFTRREFACALNGARAVERALCRGSGRHEPAPGDAGR